MVGDVDRKLISRKPPPAFITSTLQQEASKKIGLSPTRCMALGKLQYSSFTIVKLCNSLAQELYEGGFITYMRTDSPVLSITAINASVTYVNTTFGSQYLHEYYQQQQLHHEKGVDAKQSLEKLISTAPKNAQEAHEAIRPAEINGCFRTPEECLDLFFSQEQKNDQNGGNQQKLYELYTLIFRRTIASVMSNCQSQTFTYTISAKKTVEGYLV